MGVKMKSFLFILVMNKIVMWVAWFLFLTNLQLGEEEQYKHIYWPYKYYINKVLLHTDTEQIDFACTQD